jgi:hypothetical protein
MGKILSDFRITLNTAVKGLSGIHPDTWTTAAKSGIKSEDNRSNTKVKTQIKYREFKTRITTFRRVYACIQANS